MHEHDEKIYELSFIVQPKDIYTYTKVKPKETHLKRRKKEGKKGNQCTECHLPQGDKV